MMEKVKLENDINVICMKAKRFPEDVLNAHKQLHSLIEDKKRMFFGISNPDKRGAINYKAGAEEKYSGEAQLLNCDVYVIKKGIYNCIEIRDYHKNVAAIGEAFRNLISDSEIDPNGECVEIYSGTSDVKCMVRLK